MHFVRLRSEYLQMETTHRESDRQDGQFFSAQAVHIPAPTISSNIIPDGAGKPSYTPLRPQPILADHVEDNGDGVAFRTADKVSALETWMNLESAIWDRTRGVSSVLAAGPAVHPPASLQ